METLIETPREVTSARVKMMEIWANSDLTSEYDGGFGGELADVEALDYLDYEAYLPAKDWEAVALVWGAVLRKQFKLAWARCGSGELWLTAQPESTYPQVALHPHSRIAEAFRSSWPQFCKLTWAYEQAVVFLTVQGHVSDGVCPALPVSIEGANYIKSLRSFLSEDWPNQQMHTDQPSAGR